jgi:paraquat-inducible protein A
MKREPAELTLGRQAGLAICEGCLAVCRAPRSDAPAAPVEALRCWRCDGRVHLRIPDSLQRTSAYLLAAAILYLPANLLPVMHTSTVLGEEDDTILSGVLVLLHTGSWPLAMLVFFASVVVPLLKILSIGFLVAMSAMRARSHELARARLYRVVEFVGRWSMLDIYVVTLLAALVRMGKLAAVAVGPGALAFAAVVVLTMLASQNFDPRSIWDPLEADDRARRDA